MILIMPTWLWYLAAWLVALAGSVQAAPPLDLPWRIEAEAVNPTAKTSYSVSYVWSDAEAKYVGGYAPAAWLSVDDLTGDVVSTSGYAGNWLTGLQGHSLLDATSGEYLIPLRWESFQISGLEQYVWFWVGMLFAAWVMHLMWGSRVPWIGAVLLACTFSAPSSAVAQETRHASAISVVMYTRGTQAETIPLLRVGSDRVWVPAGQYALLRGNGETVVEGSLTTPIHSVQGMYLSNVSQAMYLQNFGAYYFGAVDLVQYEDFGIDSYGYHQGRAYLTVRGRMTIKIWVDGEGVYWAEVTTPVGSTFTHGIPTQSGASGTAAHENVNAIQWGFDTNGTYTELLKPSDMNPTIFQGFFTSSVVEISTTQPTTQPTTQESTTQPSENPNAPPWDEEVTGALYGSEDGLLGRLSGEALGEQYSWLGDLASGSPSSSPADDIRLVINAIVPGAYGQIQEYNPAAPAGVLSTAYSSTVTNALLGVAGPDAFMASLFSQWAWVKAQWPGVFSFIRIIGSGVVVWITVIQLMDALCWGFGMADRSWVNYLRAGFDFITFAGVPEPISLEDLEELQESHLDDVEKGHPNARMFYTLGTTKEDVERTSELADSPNKGWSTPTDEIPDVEGEDVEPRKYEDD